MDAFGTDNQDITVDGRERWFRRFAELVEQSAEFGSIRSWSVVAGLAQNTVSGYQTPDRKIPVRMLIAVNDSLDYSVDDQLADLTGRPVQSFGAGGNVQAADARGAGRRGPSVGDLTRAVLESCARETRVGLQGPSPYGRWRSRLFDIPLGWALPHVGYHAVEFMRWYGPARGKAEDRYPSKQWWAEAAEPGYAINSLKPLVASYWFRDGKPDNFAGTDEDWIEHRLERLELVARLGPLYAPARVSPYGSFGNFTSLLRHLDKATHRHIFTQQPYASTPDLALSAACADPAVRTIIVAGHASVRPIPIAIRLGEALGWEVVDFRTMEAVLTGQRPNVSAHATASATAAPGVRFWNQVKAESASRRDMLVVTVNLQYLLIGAAGRLKFRDDVIDMLNDPSVAIVFLDADTDIRSGATSANLWEDRRQAMSSKYVEPAVDTKSQAAALSRIVQDAADRFPKALVATVLPTYLYWGDAYVDPLDDTKHDDDLRQYLWHPSVGDVDVRVAYELARALVEGKPVGSAPTGSDADTTDFRSFLPDSVIYRYRARLREMTGGTHWNRGREKHGWLPPTGWNGVFTNPPDKWMRGIHQVPSLTALVNERSSWLTGGLRADESAD
ncbi:hypothetical protein D6T64_03285 [Cryobacterium melibiosiphilum]|uniref:Uncharacterized protein n=1 Tax=Cryobacterium melibiosiphilum TaxID=995039 RepID=A0A3A5MSE5_9MICO|nr:hypothetical protein [Cryobacterium melibiosiphilum]RJT90769.1 hypothetical protein D6T64_03285 [Cryobacterium melibiosiphilum]